MFELSNQISNFAKEQIVEHKEQWKMEVTPKKYLGQHFLKDLNIAQQISESLNITEPTKVIEVGPGMGVLTQFLSKNPLIDLKVVEIDKESIDYLRSHFEELKDNIIEGDFLKLDLKEIMGEKFCIIGNYPYNISSQIFFKVLENKDFVPCCSGMIQKEVAERIASKPGCKAYGILSVLLQAYYDIEYLFTVSESVFYPVPKVKSAVIRLKRNNTKKLDCDEKFFKVIVKTAFNQRRKMMRNSLQLIVGKENPIIKNDIFTKRPEQLSVSDFVYLTNLINNNIP